MGKTRKGKNGSPLTLVDSPHLRRDQGAGATPAATQPPSSLHDQATTPVASRSLSLAARRDIGLALDLLTAGDRQPVDVGAAIRHLENARFGLDALTSARV